MHQRAQARTRSVPPALRSVISHFERILTVDGSMLDALVRKVGLLREAEERPLAGKLMGLLITQWAIGSSGARAQYKLKIVVS